MAERRDRTERLLNLVLCLLGTSRPVPRHVIEKSVEGYGGATSPAAFERMFERDKDDLRALGIPIETMHDVDGTVIGYSIPRDQYSDIRLDLDPAQARLVSLVPLLWTEEWARAATLAQKKIEVQLADPAPVRIPRAVEGKLTPPPLGVDVIIKSFADPARTLQFHYTSLAGNSSHRHVAPSRLRVRSSQWYLRGFDLEAREHRTFRVSRMQAVRLGEPFSDLGVSDPESESPGERQEDITVMVNPEQAAELRLHAREIRTTEEGQEFLTLDVDPWMIRWLLLRAGTSAALDPTDPTSANISALVARDALAVARKHGVTT